MSIAPAPLPRFSPKVRAGCAFSVPVELHLSSRLTLSGVVVAILIVLCAATSAQDIDWKKGKLGHLIRLIGTYDNDALLGDPQVKQALAQVVGKDVRLLKENLAVRGPIDFIDGDLVLTGLAPHMGGVEEATLWVKVYDGSVRAVIMHEGKVTI